MSESLETLNVNLYGKRRFEYVNKLNILICDYSELLTCSVIVMMSVLRRERQRDTWLQKRWRLCEDESKEKCEDAVLLAEKMGKRPLVRNARDAALKIVKSKESWRRCGPDDTLISAQWNSLWICDLTSWVQEWGREGNCVALS